MRYQIPDTLHGLRRWMEKHHAPADFATERQATFMAQQIAGTRFKFPAPGTSCFPVLQAIEKAVTGDIANGEKPSGRKRVSRRTNWSEMSATADKSDTRPGAEMSPMGDKSGPMAPACDLFPIGDTTASNGRKKGHKGARRVEVTPYAIPDVSTGLIIFADGACEPNPGAGGWGFVVYRDGVEIHTDCGGEPQSTNQRMELTAVTRALEWFAARGVVEPVRLLSDSRYTVDGANSWRHGWKVKGWRRGKPNSKGPGGEVANLDLWKALDEVLTLVPITLEWVKGHAGIVGNERADELSLIGREAVLAACPKPNNLIEEQLRYAI